MSATKKNAIRWTTGVVCLLGVGGGWLLSSVLLAAAGAVGLLCLILPLGLHKRRRRRTPPDPPPEEADAAATPTSVDVSEQAPDPEDTDVLIEQMLSRGRFALLLRPQIASNLDDRQLHRALEALAEDMALVPDGEVVLGRSDELPEEGTPEEAETAAVVGRVILVERFFLDRHPVTNRQF